MDYSVYPNGPTSASPYADVRIVGPLKRHSGSTVDGAIHYETFDPERGWERLNRKERRKQAAITTKAK
jgi:hypothetical protein